MPIFEYTCRDCGKKCELLLKSSDNKVICPFCKSSNMKKLISSFAMQGFETKGEGGGNHSCSSCSGGSCGSCGH